MVLRSFFDRYYSFEGWRCPKCGTIVDGVIKEAEKQRPKMTLKEAESILHEICRKEKESFTIIVSEDGKGLNFSMALRLENTDRYASLEKLLRASQKTLKPLPIVEKVNEIKRKLRKKERDEKNKFALSKT